ncbi:uncharacterized protein LOC112687671 isoform X2 [Sipha flava]|uniref:Uncharacterized protein LOC112687671 isoform X2 n=1 Tax=Sipha flava TaxID=143950 RepID=A0A2S2Q6V2_9HEMI|nr:uncharacterized protein LOC112687671 isoform X2 [Sipha flava]
MSLPESRWLLVVAVLAAWWTAAAVGRPAAVDESVAVPVNDDDGEPAPNEENASGTFVGVPEIRNLQNVDAALCRRLAAMTDRDLAFLEAGLSNIGGAPPQEDEPADGEMMMGDMPQADAITQDQWSSATAPVTVRTDLLFLERESSKKRRIQSIQNQIMQYMGRSSPSQISPIPTNSNQPTAVKKIMDTVTNLMSYPSDVMHTESAVEKVQSFFPICYVPKNTNDDDNWNSKKAMNLMFSISLPKAPGGVSVNINMTKLRLFKHFITCTSQTSVETDDSQICQPISSKKNAKLANSSSAEAMSTTEDKQIRVSVYIRLMKKKVTVKRKLLDSRMLPYYGEKWTEWNIHKAFKTWRNQTHNFTITVEVEDEDGNFLPVTRFFKPMNCTEPEQTIAAISKPIPGLVMESVHKGLQNDGDETMTMSPQMALSLNLPRYPIVDVTTVEVPAVAEQGRGVAQLFNRHAVVAVRTTSWRPDRSNEHGAYPRIRHGNGSHNKAAAEPTDPDTLPPPAMDFSRMGEDLRDRVVNKIVLVKVKATTTTETPTGSTASPGAAAT